MHVCIQSSSFFNSTILQLVQNQIPIREMIKIKMWFLCLEHEVYFYITYTHVYIIGRGEGDYNNNNNNNIKKWLFIHETSYTRSFVRTHAPFLIQNRGILDVNIHLRSFALARPPTSPTPQSQHQSRWRGPGYARSVLSVNGALCAPMGQNFGVANMDAATTRVRIPNNEQPVLSLVHHDNL